MGTYRELMFDAMYSGDEVLGEKVFIDLWETKRVNAPTLRAWMQVGPLLGTTYERANAHHLCRKLITMMDRADL